MFIEIPVDCVNEEDEWITKAIINTDCIQSIYPADEEESEFYIIMTQSNRMSDFIDKNDASIYDFKIDRETYETIKELIGCRTPYNFYTSK